MLNGLVAGSINGIIVQKVQAAASNKTAREV